MKKIYLISLGCPRNMLDSEVLLGLLEKKGMTITEDPEGSDVAVVNTCGFIKDAKEESLDIVLRLAELKKKGSVGKLVVAGCLAQRYPRELMDEIGEIDGIFGTADITKIPDMMDTLLEGGRVREVSPRPDFLYDHDSARKILTPPHSVYLKIQEGCSNRCSYCVIPALKGPRRSRSIGSVTTEAEMLRARYGVRELLLIGQDTTSFGLDTSGRLELADLLRKVSPIMRDGWVRLLYTHPAHFTDDLIGVIASEPNICKYVDLPIQHINDRILRSMNRRVSKDDITGLIGRVRAGIKGVIIRTSIIVGFPGETEEEFEELIRFLEDTRFDRLGAFIYSREEGTPAAGFEGQVPDDLKKERFDRVMLLQQKISAESNSRHLGETIKVLVEEKSGEDPGRYIGRGQMDAPEVDGVIYIKGRGLDIGDFAEVRITGAMEYDLIGETV